MKAPTVHRLTDTDAERVRAEHHRAIVEMQASPLAGAVVLSNVTIGDGATVPIPHGLGRIPRFVLPTCPRGALSMGGITEVRTSAYDARKFVVLHANGWGADIVIDVVVG